jgi:hypothetical protein
MLRPTVAIVFARRSTMRRTDSTAANGARSCTFTCCPSVGCENVTTSIATVGLSILVPGLEGCVDLRKTTALNTTDQFTGREVDEFVYDFVRCGVGWLSHLSIAPPYWLGLSAVAVRGCGFVKSRTYPFDPAGTFDRDEVHVPGTIIEQAEASISTLIRPSVNMLWQASGWLSGSTSFRDDGSLDTSRP